MNGNELYEISKEFGRALATTLGRLSGTCCEREDQLIAVEGIVAGVKEVTPEEAKGIREHLERVLHLR